ncbi:MAG: DUF4236 domain-containing protein [Chloroflexota bacterium]|nr:DUF4236 domain-containing protein [Chloroflexota bacterium]
MGFRMRKSIKLGGGVRLNLSRSGIGMSGGVKGFRVGVGPRGTRVSASLPGTGLGYSTTIGGKRRRRRAVRQPASVPGLTAAQTTALRAIPAARYRSGVGTFYLWLLLGLVGGHRYYLGRKKTAVFQTVTLGGVGVWWLVDLFLLRRLVTQANDERRQRWLATPIPDTECRGCGTSVSTADTFCRQCGISVS